MDQVCPWIQVPYRPSTARPTDPAQLGPGMYACVEGFRFTWPSEQLTEECACIHGLIQRLRGLAQIAHVNPGDPVERWLQAADPKTVLRLGAIVDALEKLDAQRDEGLKSAIEAELRLTIERFRQSDLLTRGDRQQP
jgi:hypothetical protein